MISSVVATVPTHRTLQAFQGKQPTLGSGAFVAPNASVIGDVKLGNNSSVWYGAVLRGEAFTLMTSYPDFPFFVVANSLHDGQQLCWSCTLLTLVQVSIH